MQRLKKNTKKRAKLMIKQRAKLMIKQRTKLMVKQRAKLMAKKRAKLMAKVTMKKNEGDSFAPFLVLSLPFVVVLDCFETMLSWPMIRLWVH